MSCVADHQEGGSVWCIDHADFFKARFLVGPYCARIGRVGIGDDPWRTGSQQPIDEGSDKRRAMTAIHHVQLTDELVDAAGPPWLRAQPVIRPDLGIVALQISEASI